MRVSTFNCEWRLAGSRDGQAIKDRVFASDPDIVCFTEAYRDFCLDYGFVIESAEDYGYPIIPGRRKVLLWSKRPWQETTHALPSTMPPGRFVAGRTASPSGEVDVIGVCIPWSGAHVSTGNRNRQPWEDHLAYLDALDEWLPASPKRTILVGDFNQRIPRLYQPEAVFQRLQSVVLSRFNLATDGTFDGAQKQSIDHICHSRDLVGLAPAEISNIGEDGRLISDHFGVTVALDCQYRIHSEPSS